MRSLRVRIVVLLSTHRQRGSLIRLVLMLVRMVMLVMVVMVVSMTRVGV